MSFSDLNKFIRLQTKHEIDNDIVIREFKEDFINLLKHNFIDTKKFLISIVLFSVFRLNKYFKYTPFKYHFNQIKSVNKVSADLLNRNPYLYIQGYGKSSLHNINHNIISNLNEKQEKKDLERRDVNLIPTNNDYISVVHIPILQRYSLIDFSSVLNIRLSGIKNLSEEGKKTLDNIFNLTSNRIFPPKFKVLVNNVIILDDTKLDCWLFYRHNIFSKWENVNLLLISNGYADFHSMKQDFTNLKINDYMNEMFDAYRLAKRKGIGIHFNRKKVIYDSYVESNLREKSLYTRTYEYIKYRFNLSGLDKILLKKYKKI